MRLRLTCTMALLVVSCPLAAVADDDYAPASSAEPARDTARVRFTSPGRSQTIRLEGSEEARIFGSCVTPCELRAPPGNYRLDVSGRGVRRQTAQLVLRREGVDVSVRAASKAGFAWGVVLTGFGGVTTAASMALGIAALTSVPGDSYNQFMAGVSGGTIVVVGLPALVAGILLLRANERGVEASPPPATGLSAAW